MDHATPSRTTVPIPLGSGSQAASAGLTEWTGGARSSPTSLRVDAAYLSLNLLLSIYRRVAIPHVHVLHRERLPSGPKILTPNHDYMSDAFALPAVFPGRLAFLIQAESFALPIVGRLLSASGQIPVEPARPGRSLQWAAERLGRGWSVVIFPEGRLNHGGRTGRACTGAVRLSLMANVPLLPIGLHVPGNCVRFFHGRYGGRWTRAGWQVRGMCVVAIGDPWRPLAGPSARPSQANLRAAADELRDRIQALSVEAKQEAESCVSLW